MEPDNKNESFRDSIATIDKQGKRSWIFPKKPSGKLFKLRISHSVFWFAIY
jgi:hypothetical protein